MKQLLGSLLLIFFAGRLPAQNSPEVIRLTVRANPAPVPALKYPLLPKPLDIRPGNAALLYYRAFSPEWWANFQRQKKEFWDKADAVRKLPLSKLKPEDLLIPLPANMLREVDRAARREYCDWELAPRLAEDGVGIEFPDIQSLRTIIVFLSIRARQEMLAGNIDAAVYTAQTSLQMAKHTGEGASYINALIGIAVGMVASQQIEELIQLPQAPNMYWSLSQLPRPFVDLTKPMRGEQGMIEHEFAKIREMENGPVSPEQAQKVVDYLVGRSPYWDIPMDKATLAFEFAALYPKAKRAMETSGVKATEIEKMPATQIVLLYSLRQLERINDERAKWMALPYAEGREGLKRVDDEARMMAENYDAPPFVTQFGAALHKIYGAQVRIDRKIAILRCVEAIKLYASETGKPPAALADIKSVPVPLDPMTNKPFEYRLENGMAILTAPLLGELRGNGWTYEIKIEK